MNKLKYQIIIFVGAVLALTSCEVDNYPYPDAQFIGAIRDSLDFSLVEQDLQSGSTIGAYELGYGTQVLQSWVIKENGEFRNNFVYSNTYDFEYQSCNFFPHWVKGVVINPGPNERDFNVVPYIRIRNCNITYDAANDKIVATFSLEPGKPTVKVSKITLYAFTDVHVGEYVKFSTATGTGQYARTFSPAATINTETVYTLSIDLSANASLFAIHRNYYFRVGAMATQSGVGTIRTNYAPYVKIAL
jgi:hypothetical protein